MCFEIQPPNGNRSHRRPLPKPQVQATIREGTKTCSDSASGSNGSQRKSRTDCRPVYSSDSRGTAMEAGQTQSAGWGQKYPSYRGQEYLTQSPGRAVAGPRHVRKTRTIKCTMTGGLLQPSLRRPATRPRNVIRINGSSTGMSTNPRSSLSPSGPWHRGDVLRRPG
jgi:hypothetical protein